LNKAQEVEKKQEEELQKTKRAKKKIGK
jgi:hypothetical protein